MVDIASAERYAVICACESLEATQEIKGFFSPFTPFLDLVDRLSERSCQSLTKGWTERVQRFSLLAAELDDVISHDDFQKDYSLLLQIFYLYFFPEDMVVDQWSLDLN